MTDCEKRARLGGPVDVRPAPAVVPAWAESEGRVGSKAKRFSEVTDGAEYTRLLEAEQFALLAGGLYEQRAGAFVPTVLRERMLGQPERPERVPQNVAGCEVCWEFTQNCRCPSITGVSIVGINRGKLPPAYPAVRNEPVSANPGQASKADELECYSGEVFLRAIKRWRYVDKPVLRVGARVRVLPGVSPACSGEYGIVSERGAFGWLVAVEARGGLHGFHPSELEVLS